MDKVAVFLDYENVHRTGHQQYGGVGQPRHETVVNPLLIAERLMAKRRDGGMLQSVWVYRGRPVPEYQPNLLVPTTFRLRRGNAMTEFMSLGATSSTT